MRRFFVLLAALAVMSAASAQTSAVGSALYKLKSRTGKDAVATKVAEKLRVPAGIVPDSTLCEQPEEYPELFPLQPAISVADSLLADSAAVAHVGIIEIEPIPLFYLVPAVFDTYRYLTPDSLSPSPSMLPESAAWLMRQQNIRGRMTRTLQDYFLNHSTDVKYNRSWMPEPPKKFETVIDPSTQKIEVREVKVDPKAGQGIEAEKVDRRHWFQTLSANLQFSQAYISPNWYQGGNNNMNLIGDFVWNVKLNQNYHPNLLFENTVRYKIGINNAPNDTLRSYSISDDLLQINTTFGLKAAKRFYYSLTMQFKTQLFNSYGVNSDKLRSAFLSPGNFNLGVGITYNYAKKNLNFDASLNPLSYDLKICTNRRLNPTSFGIEEGRHSISQYGSNAELKLRWVMAYNISLQSRFFFFTNYESAYADWENTLSFNINRFLSTQIYINMRYDTTTPKGDDPGWRKFQLKEILSFGFSYKFATI